MVNSAGTESTWFWTLLCGGSSDNADLCIWQTSGLVALLVGGFWLLMMLAKWKLAPRDERQSPEPLALVIASVIVIGALITLGSNTITVNANGSPPEAPTLDSQEG